MKNLKVKKLVGRQQRKATDIPMPLNRIKCAFCSKPLVRGKSWIDLQICTTDGVAILTCSEHAEAGDGLVQQAVQVAHAAYMETVKRKERQ